MDNKTCGRSVSIVVLTVVSGRTSMETVGENNGFLKRLAARKEWSFFNQAGSTAGDGDEAATGLGGDCRYIAIFGGGGGAQ
jgi:hypothetical protein